MTDTRPSVQTDLRAPEQRRLRSAGPQNPSRREGSRAEAWDAIATGYDRTNTPTQMAIAEEGLGRAGLRRGMHFLDVAAGSGALAIPAARRGARVLATDVSPAMLRLLERRARNEGLEIETRVMDGQSLDLADDTFDMAGSQFGVMLFPDMPAGLREMARVVRPGGRVLVHAYGDPHEIEFLGFLVRAVQSVRSEFEGPPTDPPPLEFQLSDPGTMRRALTAAGLSDVTVETVTEAAEYESGEALWEWLVSSNPIVEKILDCMLGLTDDERRRVRAALGDLVRKRTDENGVARLTNPVHIGIGTAVQ